MLEKNKTKIAFSFIFYLASVVFNPPLVFSDEIYLKNRDRISGTVIEDTDESILLKTQALGDVLIKKSAIRKIVRRAEIKPPSKTPIMDTASRIPVWKREAALGLGATMGNVQQESLSAAASIQMERKLLDELNISGRFYYSSNKKKMDNQKWNSNVRYALYYGRNKMWYHLYKFQIEHDRFLNVDYRLIPSAGIGRYFIRNGTTKLGMECAFGFEYTDYRQDPDINEKAIFIPRAYYEQKIFDRITVSENLFLYPTLEDIMDYRIVSESVVNCLFTEKISLRFSILDEYASKPPEATKKNDLIFLSSLVYSF